jgi:hypothetical protein
MYYRNLENVRNAFVKYEYSKQEKYVYSRSWVSVSYFINKFFFKLDKRDRFILNCIKESRFLLNGMNERCLKIQKLYMLHQLMFSMDLNVGFIAKNKDVAQSLLDEIKSLYKSLPYYIQVGVSGWKKDRIYFDNGSGIYAYSSHTMIYGRQIHTLFMYRIQDISDTCYMNLYRSIFPLVTCLNGSRIFLYGDGNPDRLNGNKFDILL